MVSGTEPMDVARLLLDGRTTPMTPEQQVDAVKAALAEAGYPNARVSWSARLDATEGVTVWLCSVDRGTAWRALTLVKERLGLVDDIRCWPCSLGSSRRMFTCTHDYRSEPWPEVVR